MKKKDYIDSLLSTPNFYHAKVSPDLKNIIWTWHNLGPVGDVYITSLDKNEEPRKLTDFGFGTRLVSWTQDSKFAIVSHDYDGDERHRLYKVDINTGENFALTEEHSEFFIRGGHITPDGKYLVYGANFDFETNKEIEPTLVYRQDLETGEKIKLAEPQKPAFLFPEINKQGTYIIYDRNDIHPKGVQTWMVDINGNEDREILNFGDEAKVDASWHPNGKDIIFVAEIDGYRKVGIFNFDSGKVTWILDDSKRNIEGAYVPVGSRLVVINEVKNAQSIFSIIDPETLKEKPFSELKLVYPFAQISEDEWVSRYYNSSQPNDLVVHNKTKIVSSLTRVFEKVDYTQEDLSRAENYNWNSIDGLRIQGWLYKTKKEPLGTIVLIHGGPTYHREDEWSSDIQYFVSQGFNVLDPNYRGSTGFSLDFEESIKKEGWGGKEQDDIVEGIKSLINDGIAKEGKVGVTGTSYGGYSAWFAITHFPRKYVAASVPICGMTDLVVDYETTRPDLRGYSEEMIGGSPSEVPERYYNGSPINFIEKIEADLLIVQGAKDPNVSLENVKVAKEKLEKYNIKYEEMIFEDEGHGISKPKNKKELFKKSTDFFKESFGNSFV